MALGTGSLTVNEQATMLSTIDNGGTYHQAHVIQSWQSPEGTVQIPRRGDRTRCSPRPSTRRSSTRWR